MGGRLKRYLISYFRENALVYIIICLVFSIGIFSGAIGVKPLISGQQVELLAYVDNFLATLIYTDMDTFNIALTSVLKNLQLVFLIWFLGLTVIGVPIILLLVFVRGFVLGFTVGFLAQEKAMQGILISTFSILPPNLLLIPGLIIAAVSAVTFSMLLIKGQLRNRSMRLVQHFISYSMLMAVMAIVLIAAALIEAYISPSMMKLISVYVN